LRKGVITEWYPQASRVEPTAALYDASLNGRQPDGSIFVGRGDRGAGSAGRLPCESRENHYYAARQTASTPVFVKTPRGEQREKFLFYRGVANFAVPVAAAMEPIGGQVLIEKSRRRGDPGRHSVRTAWRESGVSRWRAVKDRANPGAS